MASWSETYPLEWRKVIKKTLASTLLLVIILGVFYIFFMRMVPSDTEVPSIITGILNSAILIVVLIIALVFIYQLFYLKYYFYDSTAKLLIIKKGVFSKNEINLPYKRIQDVYVDQDILDRIFQLYDVHVSSATSTSGFLSHIDGLNKDNAEKVKQLILKQVHR